MKNGKFDQVKYVNSYNAEHYDRIELKVPAGTKAEWMEKAKARGMSLTSFIVDCVSKSCF